jgi:hypothetical protein
MSRMDWGIDMTRKQAEKAGWKITGTGANWTAEKGRFIFMGPSLALVLLMIETTGKRAHP